MKQHRTATSDSDHSDTAPAPAAATSLGNQALLALMASEEAPPAGVLQSLGALGLIPAGLIPTGNGPPARIPLPHEIPDEVLERAAPGPGAAPDAPKPERAERAEVPFGDLPAAFRGVAGASFDDPSRWYHGLLPVERADTIDIYNRLVAAGLWGQVTRLRAVAAPEADLDLGIVRLGVRGRTVSVAFEVADGPAFSAAIARSGRFGKDGPVMGAAHAGQDSFRQASSEDGTAAEDGMHVSVGPGNRADAHVDRISPVGRPDAQGQGRPVSPRMLGHGVEELIPDLVRGVFGVPGVTPLQTDGSVRRADPTDTPYEAPTHGPFIAPPIGIPLIGDALRGLWTAGARTSLRFEFPAGPQRITPLPAGSKNTTGAPMEGSEVARIDGAVRGLRGTLAPPGRDEGDYNDTAVVARELARRMVAAAASGDRFVDFDHGPMYAELSAAERCAIGTATREIAAAVRSQLGDRGASVLRIRVGFGGGRAEIFEL